MIYAKPGEAYTAVLNAGATGLVGTLTVQLERADGTTVAAPVTAGIVEVEPTIYAKDDLVAPSTAGTYIVVWDNAGVRASEELTVTTGPLPFEEEAPSGRILDLAAYKTRREIDNSNKDRDEAITAALLSAEDAILKYTGRDLTTEPAAGTREYPYSGEVILETDDFTALTSVAVNGITQPSDAYFVGPREGETYYWIDFSPRSQGPTYSEGQMGFTRNLDTAFSSGRSRRYVTVTVKATFGWPGGAPAGVQQAVVFLVDEFRKSQGSVGDIQAESIADLSYVYQRDAEGNAVLPPRVQLLLDPYRRVAL